MTNKGFQKPFFVRAMFTFTMVTIFIALIAANPIIGIIAVAIIAGKVDESWWL